MMMANARTRSDMLPHTDLPTKNRPQNAGAAVDDDASRLDGVAKTTGRAKYGRDMYLEDMLFVGFIRCPYGKATLESMNEGAAGEVPGVVEVVRTGEQGNYHGHPVGYVVAESKPALRRALRALQPQWKIDRSLTTTITDHLEREPELSAELREAMTNADHVLRAVYATPVQTHAALETHGVSIDRTDDRATVYASTQGTFTVKDGITEPLGLPDAKVEVVCEYIGGGFGAKFGAGKEGMTAAQVSAKHHRPVSLFVDRDEEHLDTGNRPSSRSYVTIAFGKDGEIIAGQIDTFGGVGVDQGGGGVRFPSGRYAIEVPKNHRDISFNAGGPRAMRAPGFPQGAFAEELLIDEIATICGIDPLEYRLRLDGDADRRTMYEQGAERIGWGDRAQTGGQSSIVRTGYGVGSTSWGAFPSQAEAEVVINRDGSVVVRSGAQDIGTGFRTIVGIEAADALGVPLPMITVECGRSTLPEGPASGGSVTSPNTMPAVRLAALDAKSRLLRQVAERLSADVSEFAIVEGAVWRHDEPLMSFSDACRNIRGGQLTGRGGWNAQRDRRRHAEIWGDGHSHGVQFVKLQVDTETGEISVDRVIAYQSCGRVLCRKTAESQIIGGVIQGLSYALFEEKLLDPQLGAMVNPNLEQYKILGSGDMPDIVPILWTRGQTGVRSLGEPPVVPTAGAAACALFNALGRPVRELPLTPDKVLAALEGGAA